MHNFYMMVGVPGSGKTSYLKERLIRNEEERNAAIISSDRIIEIIARDWGFTYDEIFKDVADFAHKVMYRDLGDAIKHGDDIFWDQTNLSYGTRKKKLDKIPNEYTKTALVFETPGPVELDRRIKSREGKYIPKDVLEKMINNYQEPSISEGFDFVAFYQTDFSDPIAPFESRFILKHVNSRFERNVYGFELQQRNTNI